MPQLWTNEILEFALVVVSMYHLLEMKEATSFLGLFIFYSDVLHPDVIQPHCKKDLKV